MRGALLILLLAACAPHRLPASSTPAPAVSAPVPEPPEPTPHADYAALRPFHHYYRVLAVGENLQHWRAWYVDSELVRGYLTAKPDGTGVTFLGYDWGLDEAEHHDDFPPAQAKVAASVHAVVQAHEHADAFAVAYLGTYREVTIEEIVPHDEPGDASTRMAGSATQTLAVDDGFTKVIGSARRVDTGSTDNRLCWLAVRDCGPAPYWLDALADREGRPRVWAIADPSSDVPPPTRDAFEQAILAGAAGFAAGTPPPALASLRVQAGDALLPDDLDDTVLVGLDADVETKAGQIQSYVTVPLSVSRAAAGEARGTARYFFDGRDLALTASLTVALPAGAHGRVDLPAKLAYWVKDGAHAVTRHDATFTIAALVDGARVMPVTPPGGDLGFDEKIDRGDGALHVAVHLHAPD